MPKWLDSTLYCTMPCSFVISILLSTCWRRSVARWECLPREAQLLISSRGARLSSALPRSVSNARPPDIVCWFSAHKKYLTSCAGYFTINVPDFVHWFYQLIKSTRLRELRTWRRWLRISPCLLNCCQTSGRLPMAQQLKKAQGKGGNEKDPSCVEVQNEMEVSKLSGRKGKSSSTAAREKRSFDDEGGKDWALDTRWFLIRCSILWRGVLSGNSSLLVKPKVRKIPLLFAPSLLGDVVIKRWRDRLWPTPWLNVHYTLSSAEQGRHQQKHMVQGGFCVEIPAPGHGMFQQNYWMLCRGSWRMG